MITPTLEKPHHSRHHRRQNTQLPGFYATVYKDTSNKPTTSITAVTPPSPANDACNNIAKNLPPKGPRHRRQNAYFIGSFEDNNTSKSASKSKPTAAPRLDGGDMHQMQNKNTSRAVSDNTTAHLINWQHSKRYLMCTPVSPYSEIHQRRHQQQHNSSSSDCSSSSSSSSSSNLAWHSQE
jgi:hypothetical protein